MGRTRQTARKSVGGSVPRRQLSGPLRRFNTNPWDSSYITLPGDVMEDLPEYPPACRDFPCGPDVEVTGVKYLPSIGGASQVIPLELRASPDCGLGLWNKELIRSGTCCLEYTGVRQTEGGMYAVGDVEGDCINAEDSGNESRFINHFAGLGNGTPNVVFRYWRTPMKEHCCRCNENMVGDGTETEFDHICQKCILRKGEDEENEGDKGDEGDDMQGACSYHTVAARPDCARCIPRILKAHSYSADVDPFDFGERVREAIPAAIQLFRVFIFAVGDIQPNTQLLADYGHEYWDGMGGKPWVRDKPCCACGKDLLSDDFLEEELLNLQSRCVDCTVDTLTIYIDTLLSRKYTHS
jgi:hypothetical protein